MIHEKIEPRESKDQKKSIFGTNQNHYQYIDPKYAYQVDEKGYKTKKRLPGQETIIAHYWAKKQKTIAIIGAISVFTPMTILIQETGILDLIFQKIGEGIGWIIGTIFGALIP